MLRHLTCLVCGKKTKDLPVAQVELIAHLASWRKFRIDPENENIGEWVCAQCYNDIEEESLNEFRKI